MKTNTFVVPCCAEIDNHIGKARAYIIGDGPSDWYIDTVENGDSAIAGDLISDELYQEIESEVIQYFVNRNENLIELMKEEGRHEK